MFSKAKRFGDAKNDPKEKKDVEIPKPKPKITPVAPASAKTKPRPTPTPSTCRSTDTQSQCSSVRSVKSFVTPKPLKPTSAAKCPSSLKKPPSCKKKVDVSANSDKKIADDIIKSQEVEIRNKDYTITEYVKQIEELKDEINKLQKQSKKTDNNDYANLHKQIAEIHIGEQYASELEIEHEKVVNDLKLIIASLEEQCNRLETEISSKQVELSSLEELICIRDSLCKDLQDKLTNVETTLEETRQRLEMVKGHHALALDANESIRREYKAELEAMKLKLEEEKQAVITKCKLDQEAVKTKYMNQIENITNQLNKEKDESVNMLQQQMKSKELEMKAKLEQIDEATSEKLKLCEIQFEERFRGIQEHWTLQESKIQFLEKEAMELKYSLSLAEEQSLVLQREIKSIQGKNESLTEEKASLIKEVEYLKEESKKKFIDFDNQINKLTFEVDNVMKEKKKFEMSLNVTRDIVQVLTIRLRESDSEVEHLEDKVRTLMEANDKFVNEIESYKASLNNTMRERDEYKEALENIVQSSAALESEHTRIRQHSAALAGSLIGVERSAAIELAALQAGLAADVDLLRREAASQIKALQDEVQKKHLQVVQATEAAGVAAEAAGAAEQARALLKHAAAELERLEGDNARLMAQIQDQQSLVVELSLLRQENEELSMTVAKQSSIIDKMKKDEQMQLKPKSPSVMRKNHKIGKENSPIVISPLRERNHI